LLIVASPVTVAIEFKRSDQADGAMLTPGAVRSSGRRVQITVPDMPAAYRAFRALAGLARE
jgi:D-aminopeptidase